MLEYLVVIPKSIDFQKLIDRDPEEYCRVDINIAKGILGQISSCLSFRIQKKEIFQKNLRVSLCSTRLKEVYGNGYKVAVKFLHREVLFKHPYSEKKCFSFSYNPKVIEDGFKIEKIQGIGTRSRNIVNKLIKDGNKINSNTKARFGYLIKFFDANRLKIDFKSAYEEACDNFRTSADTYKLLAQCQRIVDISNGKYTITHNPETDGRFHNNFIRLNKDFRKHLTYDGKQLAEIDISNSIPFYTILNT